MQCQSSWIQKSPFINIWLPMVYQLATNWDPILDHWSVNLEWCRLRSNPMLFTPNLMPIDYQSNSNWLPFKCQLRSNPMSFDSKPYANWLPIKFQLTANQMPIDIQSDTNWLPMGYLLIVNRMQIDSQSDVNWYPIWCKLNLNQFINLSVHQLIV